MRSANLTKGRKCQNETVGLQFLFGVCGTCVPLEISPHHHACRNFQSWCSLHAIWVIFVFLCRALTFCSSNCRVLCIYFFPLSLKYFDSIDMNLLFLFLSYSDFFHILKYQMTAVVKEHYNKYSWKRYFDFNLVKFCLFICIIIWLDSQKKYSLILINTFFSTHKNVSILVKDILCFLSNDDFSQRKIEIDSC